MPTNVSTSFFFINLLFQARRAGSNPRPSCIPRCVAARDKSRPGRRAMARAHQEGCARARGVAGRGLEKPGILRGAWPRGTSRVHGGGLMARAHQEGCARARGVVGRGLEKPGILRGAWPHGTSRAHGGGLWPALIKRVAHVRGPVPGFSIRAYGSSLSLVLIKRYSARARGVVGRGLEKPGILRGAWPYGTSCARGGGLMARAYRESCVRARGVAGQGLEGLSHGGEFGRAQCIWVGQNPRAGWGQGAVLGFLARLGGAETVLSGIVSSLALPKNWMQKTQEYQ